MLRTLVAVAAAVLLVGVLSVLIIESRSVKEDYYLEHAERMRAIDASRSDLTTIVEGTRDAFDDGRTVSSSVELAFARLTENNAVLQDAGGRHRQNEAVDLALETYHGEVTKLIADGQLFASRQNALAVALQNLQEESPLIVKDLRRFDLRIQSQNTFSLAIDIIEFATGSGHSAADLSARIETLANDTNIEAQSPGRIDEFVDAANQIVQERIAAEEALQQIGTSRIGDNLWALSNDLLNDNRVIVSRAERARLLLSVCAILLLIGTGYAIIRLQTSYRAVNRGNRELEKVNSSLEERVDERTEELSAAYDELKESQVQLVQAEKMSSLGELVAGISHEINTPLWYLMSNSAVLQGQLEELNEFVIIGEKMIDAVKSQQNVKEGISQGLRDMQKKLKDGLLDDIDEAKSLLQDSIDGLEELTELAQSLKDFSRLDRARQGEFNLNEGLDKTLLIAKNRLKNKVTVHKYYEDLPMIQCSPSQINQVFLNLLTNAADAIEDKGEVVIRTRCENDKVCVSISDTGSGIPDDILTKIRDPFFTTKDVGKGTGLGLSIVDQIVTAHGGKLEFESEAGKGTTVSMVLPVLPSVSEEELDNAAANDGDIHESGENGAPPSPADDEKELPELAAV